MGKVTGFLEIDRQVHKYQPASDRIRHFREFTLPMSDKEVEKQAARCMDCGVPYCHGPTGCPVHNQIPDWNDLVYNGDWEAAIRNLHSTNNFPEFTGRVCPAPCEEACTLNLEDIPVAIKTIEQALADKAYETGFIRPFPPESKTGKRVAIIGSGPAGMAAAQQLGRVGYSQAIVLPNSLKSALVPAFAGIPTRTGFRGEMRYWLINDMRMLSKRRLPLTVQRFVALGRAWNQPLPDPLPRPRLVADAANQARLRETLELAGDRRAVAFMPGAEYGPAKQWPLEHFAAVARELTARGIAVWILGSAKDAEAGEAIARGLPGVRNLAGRTSLGDAVDLLALCEGAVTNDSGLMHVAAALDVPLVAIFGSSSPGHTPPLAEPDRVAIRYLGLECSPCFKRTCPLGHLRCLTEITPASVLDALAGLGVAQPGH